MQGCCISFRYLFKIDQYTFSEICNSRCLITQLSFTGYITNYGNLSQCTFFYFSKLDQDRVKPDRNARILASTSEKWTYWVIKKSRKTARTARFYVSKTKYLSYFEFLICRKSYSHLSSFLFVSMKPL